MATQVKRSAAGNAPATGMQKSTSAGRREYDPLTDRTGLRHERPA